MLDLSSYSNAAVLNFSNVDDLDDLAGESFPPNSIQPGNFESNSTTFFFQEQDSFTLTSDLDVDISTIGTFNNSNSGTAGTISSGTVVNSFFFSFDPVGNSISDVVDIEFSNPILGIIHNNASLNATDVVLGRTGITYPTNVTNRAVELSGNSPDQITWVDDFNLSSEVFAGNGFVDQFRVITSADVPFEFSPSLGLLMIFLAIIAKKIFKSSKLS